MINSLKPLFTAILRDPKDFLTKSVLSWSTLWTATEISTYFLPNLDLKGRGWLESFFLVGILLTFFWNWPKQKISFYLKNSNTKITILFGDIFKLSGYKVIPVNEYFDLDLGEIVSITSLHGQFLNEFAEQNSVIKKEVATILRRERGTRTSKRSGNNIKYPIGTVVALSLGNSKYFLVALSETDVRTYKASANISQLLVALAGLWSSIRIKSGGHKVVIPLIGGGLSGVGLKCMQLLQFILISFLVENRARQITNDITFIINPDLQEEIDLKTIERGWK